MKLLTAFAIAALSLSFGASAFAQTNPSGLTRAEVRAQLVQAQAEGLVPAPKNDYPPSAATIARNHELYALGHGMDDANAVRTAGMPSANQGTASN